MQRESIIIVARDQGEGKMGSYFLISIEFQFYKMKEL